MQKEEFVRLLAKYKKGQCSEAEIRLINRWYEQVGTDEEPPLNLADRQHLERRLWQQIDRQITDPDETAPGQQNRFIRLSVVGRWAAAAVLVGLLGWSALQIHRHAARPLATGPLPSATKRALVERTNATNQPQSIVLNDGSVVLLQPHSTIQYVPDFQGKNREVWLKGQAFFQVRKDAERPFLVYSRTIVTRVLGTSFWVTAPTDAKTVEVAVHSGRVAVFKKATQSASEPELASLEDASGVVLTPNQKVTIFVEQNRLSRGLIDAPKPITSPAPAEPAAFSFDDSPLPEVLHQLERAYGIDLEISNEALANCRFSGNITRQPLYTKLELICQSLNAQYEVQGTRILINGSGCTP
ncbi:FecR family protein [Larkinella arboricola]